MTVNKNNQKKQEGTAFGKENKILLGLMPFWTPQIPPLGLACLKGHLQENGYLVSTADFNTEDEFKELNQNYFNTLKEDIPPQKRGNFYSVAQDVLRNHLMAHFNRDDEERYLELVEILIGKTFFIEVKREHVLRLNEILDRFYEKLESHIVGLLEKEKPLFLGLSVFEGTLPASLFVFKLVRERYPHIKTVMGGGIFASHLSPGSPNYDYFLEKTPYIDKLIIGEGENLFLKLLNGELNEDQRVYGLKDIGNQILDIAGVDVPDFSDFKIDNYPYMASYSSRSCPFQCSFCSETVQWGAFRKKKPEQIVDELNRLYKTYKRQLFLMGDSLLNPVISDVARLLSQNEASIYWDGYLRAEKAVCNVENTRLWRQGGFYRARLGIESGSQHVLDLMQKKITPARIKDSLYALASSGIKTTSYWVVGHPGETEEDFQQTLDLLEELKDSIYEAWCSPFYFYQTAQVNSDNWAANSRLLYPASAKDMLLLQTWYLDTDPSRELAYERMNRFVQHCDRLKIPNPYSLFDFLKADERWQKLHANAVPSIAVFDDKDNYIDENKHFKVKKNVSKKLDEDIAFDF
ncbi:MAG: radical SAM protein [bacterium]|nr:radical SAM protein [bacterium]